MRTRGVLARVGLCAVAVTLVMVGPAWSAGAFTITSSAGPHGTISPLGATTVAQGDDCTFTIKPDSNSHLTTLIVDGTPRTPTLSYTFSDVSADHTIFVGFDVNIYIITSSAGLGGTIHPFGVKGYEHGQSDTYTISPWPGYRVKNVVLDGASLGRVTSIPFPNVSAGHTIAATFELIPVKVATRTRLSGPSSVRVARNVTLYGTVAPSPAVGSVTITKKRLVGRRWVSASSARVPVRGGSYRYTFKPTKTGKWRFDAYYSGGAVGGMTYTSSKSAIKYVLVK